MINALHSPKQFPRALQSAGQRAEVTSSGGPGRPLISGTQWLVSVPSERRHWRVKLLMAGVTHDNTPDACRDGDGNKMTIHW